MKNIRILAVMHRELVPPEEVRGFDLADVDWKMEFDVTENLRRLGHEVRNLGIGTDLGEIRPVVEEWKPDLIFNLLEDLHDVGTFDHNVVGHLELLQIPYTGCNSRGLLLARDKSVSKALLSHHGIAVPKFAVLKRGKKFRRPAGLTYPLIVKSLTKDASQGISQASIVLSDDKLEERSTFIHQVVGTDAIVEQFVEGREFYVGVMGNERCQVLPVWELNLSGMKTRWRIASDRVKWNHEYQLRHRIRTHAARLTPAMEKRIQRICREAFQILRLNGYARIDLRLDADDNLYVMEANPNPQLAYGEDFAESAEHAGLDYLDLLQKIVSLGSRWDATRFG